MNEISNSKVASSSLLRLQKTTSSLDSRFADHPHTQIVPPLREELYICVCEWSANLESKLLAVFCSLRRLLLATLLFEISFNWRILRDFGIT